jgi:RNA polymerase sigma factor (sigma-70 family)
MSKDKDDWFEEYLSGDISSNEELFDKYRSGDTAACAAIVENNLGLVSFTIRKYFSWIYTKGASNAMSHNDLKQEGVIGLICSVESYDPEKGTFASHAVGYISREILKALRDKDNMIRIPGHLKTEYSKLKKLETAYINQYNAEPSMVQLSKYSGIDLKRIEMLKQVFAPIGSLDVPIGEDDEADYIGSRISDGYNHFEDVEKDITIKALHDDLERMTEECSDSKKDLRGFRLYMGWNGYMPKSFDEVGEKIGKPKEEVKKSVNKMLRKMNLKYSRELSTKYAALISYRLTRADTMDFAEHGTQELVYNLVANNLKPGSKIRVSDRFTSIDGIVDRVWPQSFILSFWSDKSNKMRAQHVDYYAVSECKFFRGEMLEVCTRQAISRFLEP